MTALTINWLEMSPRDYRELTDAVVRYNRAHPFGQYKGKPSARAEFGIAGLQMKDTTMTEKQWETFRAELRKGPYARISRYLPRNGAQGTR